MAEVYRSEILLALEFDYKHMVKEIVRNIQQACEEASVKEPDIFTEFGKYTVGESGATIFSVLGQKRQNDTELWYMIDNSLMNTIPGCLGHGRKVYSSPYQQMAQ